MFTEVKELWIEDLRANPELKGKRQLRDGELFCVMGRLCEVYRKETGNGEWEGDQFLGHFTAMPQKVLEWAGIEEPYGDLVLNGENIARINDNTETTFPEMADMIEKYL